MRFLVNGILFICLFTGSLLATAEQNDDSVFPWPDMEGIPPDKSVKNWVKFDIVAPSAHPFPIIWFSPQNFERKPMNYLVKLSFTEYKHFRKFVRDNHCSINLEDDSSLRVTEYFEGHEKVRCVMPQKKVCNYLSKLFKLPNIVWDEKKMVNFSLLLNEYWCESL